MLESHLSFSLCENNVCSDVFVCLFSLCPASLRSVLIDFKYLWFTFQLFISIFGFRLILYPFLF